jgi:hypothetical protein
MIMAGSLAVRQSKTILAWIILRIFELAIVLVRDPVPNVARVILG